MSSTGSSSTSSSAASNTLQPQSNGLDASSTAAVSSTQQPSTSSSVPVEVPIQTRDFATNPLPSSSPQSTSTAAGTSFSAPQQPAAVPQGRPFSHGSRYRWGLNWMDLFSSSSEEGEKPGWAASSSESEEMSEIEYYNLSARRPSVVNGHGQSNTEQTSAGPAVLVEGGEHQSHETETRTEVDDSVGESGGGEGWAGEPAVNGHGHEEESDCDADCEEEDVEDEDGDEEDGADEDASSEQGDDQGREEPSQQSERSHHRDPPQAPRPYPSGEWYDGDREGTIWNAGLNGL